jgi:hypothetical protein
LQHYPYPTHREDVEEREAAHLIKVTDTRSKWRFDERFDDLMKALSDAEIAMYAEIRTKISEKKEVLITLKKDINTDFNNKIEEARVEAERASVSIYNIILSHHPPCPDMGTNNILHRMPRHHTTTRSWRRRPRSSRPRRPCARLGACASRRSSPWCASAL